ncbi:MAG: response regulator [Desulfobacterales bacterium]|nr:response regulator [Desulfobacterales bacterium]
MSNNSPTTILIIDDEPIIRRSFADHLEDRDYATLTAENGRIGLEILAREQPHLVLTDLRMPEMDGLDVIRRGGRLAPDTPIIVVSGAGRMADAIEALRMGAYDYLIKPVKDLSVLEHTVEKALERARLLRENRAYQANLEALVRERTRELERANRRLSDLNTRLHKVVETTRGFSACVDVDLFGVRLLDEFARHMNARGGSLYFIEEGGLRLKHALDPGHAREFLPFPLARHSVLRRVLENGEPLLIENVADNDEFSSSGWSGRRDGSLLAFPIPDASGKTSGVLTLHGKTPPPFMEQDKEIGAILSSHGGETLRAVRAFESMRASEDRYRTLFERSSDAIFLVDARTGRYINANQAAERLTGLTLAEIETRSTRDVLPGETGRTFRSAATLGRNIDLGEVEFSRPDGVKRVATLTAVPLRGELIVGFAHDITGRKRVEEEKENLRSLLTRAQKMEAIGTLAGGIAHDFNNILQAILGWAELALMGLERDAPVRCNLEAIHQSGRRARDLVAQILAFSHGEEQIRTRVSIHLILKETLKLLVPALPSTIEIRRRIDTRSQIVGDPTRIHQIIMNLCANAYQAMSETGGALEISLSRVEIEQDSPVAGQLPPGPYIRLTVSDTGCGISPEDLNRIFDPYFTTKEKGKGTGLGLAVVHGIVKSHGGAVLVKSRVGSGSEFNVYFPAAPDDGDDYEEPEMQPPGGHERILLVDDEPNIVVVETEMLERLGYTVTATNKPDDALALFAGDPRRFDLVILDMTMPRVTGVQLAAELKRMAPDVRIILCSGYSEMVATENIHALGLRGCLQKPVSVHELAEAVRDALDAGVENNGG